MCAYKRAGFQLLTININKRKEIIDGKRMSEQHGSSVETKQR